MARKDHKSGLGITVTGFEDLDKALAELPIVMQAYLVQEATDVAAKKIVVPTARRRAPKDTGAMAASLRTRNIGYRRKRYYKGHLMGRNNRRAPNGTQVYTTVNNPQPGKFQYHSAAEMGLKKRDYKQTRFLRASLYDKKSSITIIFLRAMRKFLRKKRVLVT